MSISETKTPSNTPNDPLTVDFASIGLVLNAISGHSLEIQQSEPHAVVAIYADVTEVRSLKPPRVPKRTPKRGKITSFSRKSRKRMIRQVAKIRDLQSSIFVTLTYPGEFNFTPKQVKDHFFAFKKRFFRQYSTEGIIWRMELKTRKSGLSEGQIAPHFHLVIVHQKFISVRDMIKFVRDAWNAIVAPGDKQHWQSGTRVEIIKKRKQVMGYVSKVLGYVNKDEKENEQESNPGTWGRFWGTCGNLDMRPIETIIIDYPQFINLRREIAKSMKSAEFKRIKINRKLGKSTKTKRYYRRIKRGGKQRGFAVLGYGDQSQHYPTLQHTRIWKIISVTCCFGKQVTTVLDNCFLLWLNQVTIGNGKGK